MGWKKIVKNVLLYGGILFVGFLILIGFSLWSEMREARQHLAMITFIGEEYPLKGSILIEITVGSDSALPPFVDSSYWSITQKIDPIDNLIAIPMGGFVKGCYFKTYFKGYKSERIACDHDQFENSKMEVFLHPLVD